MSSTPSTSLPPFLLKRIGHFLKRARCAKQISLRQAARSFKISENELIQIEEGLLDISYFRIQTMAARYGIYQEHVVSLLKKWVLFRQQQNLKIQGRRHLSLVSETPRPWEKDPQTLEDLKITRNL